MFPFVGLKMTQNGTPAAAATRIGEQFDAPSRAHAWLARLVMTLFAWLAAFLIATALLRLFGDELGSLPLALRALVISGVLVALMANLVMPALSAAIARWMSGSPQAQGTGVGRA
jgi:antibiotic biosynthesis monooxygenase (ABM) superfamily enzyme